MTEESADLLLEKMQYGGHHIQLNERTRHLLIQKLLIDYVYKRRSCQLEAIAVSIPHTSIQQQNYFPREVASCHPVS